VQKIFAAVGEVVWVKEKYMDVVTGLSGSGPAFVYAFIESLIEAGRDLGLSMPLSIKLAEQTLVGSAAVFKAAKLDPIDLINMVKSPGGTTEAGLKVLEEKWFKQSVKQAVAAAARRSKELSR
jgi:pyrroline-5-carboxylate reductase